MFDPMQEDQNALECHPPRTPFWQWLIIIFLTVPIFGGLIAAGLVMAAELINHFQTTMQTRLLLLATGGGISLVLLWIFARWDQERWYWVLTPDALIGGAKQNLIFPFSTIAKIVPGLPEKTIPLVAANQFVDPAVWNAIMHARKLALLLKFSDGSFMPFHVHKCAGSSELMDEMLKRLADRIDRNYVYTQPEVKALRAADWNRRV